MTSTPMNLQVLDFVRDRITRSGFAPTYEEIARAMGITKGRAHAHVQALIAVGRLQHRPNKVRGIALPTAADLQTIDTELLTAELARRGVVPGALSRARPAAWGEVRCAARACRTAVRAGHAFCWDHWLRITPETQDELKKAHRIACLTGTAEDARRYQDAFGRAKDEAEALPAPLPAHSGATH